VGSIGELVRDGENGRVFHTSKELAEQLVVRPFPAMRPLADLLQDTLHGFPHAPRLEKLREYFTSERGGWNTWDQQWKEVVGPVLAKKEQ
jgi:beta-1,4-mannosyltransferase